MNLKSNTILSGEAIGVDVAQIEKELAQLWKDAAHVQEGDASSNAVMRACGANLVALINQGDATQEDLVKTASDAAAEVVARHPCRVMIVRVSPEADESRITASISARCQMPRGGKRICCEQINLEVPPASLPDLPGVILPLLAPEVPVYLWCLGELDFDAGYYRSLAKSLDCVLIDTAWLTDPLACSARVWKEVQQGSSPVAFRDLNWARLTPWRQLTAQFFDSPERQRFVEGLRRAVIRVGVGAPGVQFQAILLAGWLASRLGWKLVSMQASPGGLSMSTHDGTGGSIEIRSRGDIAAELESLELHSDRGNHTAFFSIQRAEDEVSAITTEQIDGGEPAHRRVRMRHRTAARLLGDELDVSGRDLVYEQALACAVTAVG